MQEQYIEYITNDGVKSISYHSIIPEMLVMFKLFIEYLRSSRFIIFAVFFALILASMFILVKKGIKVKG